MCDSTHVSSDWLLTCQSAQSHADMMAAGCRREAAALIHRETDSFCNREPPKTQSELSRRQRQAMFLASRISSIVHADLMARSHPDVASQILAETRAFLDRLDVDDPPDKESMALTSTISALCHSDMMQRL